MPTATMTPMARAAIQLVAARASANPLAIARQRTVKGQRPSNDIEPAYRWVAFALFDTGFSQTVV